MRTLLCLLLGLAAGMSTGQVFERLPGAQLAVTPSAYWITGEPGSMQLQVATCPVYPGDAVAQRIVDIALQEWAWFGFPEYTPRGSLPPPAPGEERVRRPRISEAEAARIATTVAGYWAATPGGTWILERQNEQWEGPDGIGARWRDAWSAAFISWILCEAGVPEMARFQRSIAHHAYIDQAIRVRDGSASGGIYRAYDAGEVAVRPGDLICTGSRPVYADLDARRAQLGEGARTHCDFAIGLDPEGNLLAIGGNVASLVRVKRMDWQTHGNGVRSPVDPDGSPVFAHLSLQLPTGPLLPLEAIPIYRALRPEG